MARKSKVEAERTRVRILASALALFVKKGYDRTTFVDIAARLKMTKGAVYWHFESKEALLVALVEEMLAKFRRQIEELMPEKEDLTFPAIAEMMVVNAERIVADAKGAAFFMLLKTQVKWGADSMVTMRERLQSDATYGPYHAMVEAVGNDIAAGRVRKGVNPVEVASVALAVWNGLVRARIERFLECDLASALRHTYAGLWDSIKAQ